MGREPVLQRETVSETKICLTCAAGIMKECIGICGQNARLMWIEDVDRGCGNRMWIEYADVNKVM
jgi:hypothetical protein